MSTPAQRQKARLATAAEIPVVTIELRHYHTIVDALIASGAVTANGALDPRRGGASGDTLHPLVARLGMPMLGSQAGIGARAAAHKSVAQAARQRL